MQGESKRDLPALFLRSDNSLCFAKKADSAACQSTFCLQGKKKRDFVQSFFLAVQEKGYFVLNDTFRYLSDRASRPNQYHKENGYIPHDYNKGYSQVSTHSPPHPCQDWQHGGGSYCDLCVLMNTNVGNLTCHSRGIWQPSTLKAPPVVRELMIWWFCRLGATSRPNTRTTQASSLPTLQQSATPTRLTSRK